MKEILNIIHKTIYQFFDVCEDGEEVPMSDKDKLLLEVNKAICNNLKALEQQSCEDCISRQEVNKLVDELARAISDEKCHIQRGRNYGRIMHDILELPSVKPERKGRECASCKHSNNGECAFTETCHECMWESQYEQRAEQKHGHWIDEGQYADSHSAHTYRCSECGGHIIEYRPDDFCKHCGADMREVAHESDNQRT